ncbi:hypothetical protein QJS10_CPB11g00448 [Acorus calamus]|uniref:BED-type domain-containing protein n=1 Tax=Acorus calamus TaxID=4465 RepID=A0AAV9DVY9_ACOCL|nr:hypothetical protein QJS10_CPB11g00448 [Acorus calamus]
MGTGIPETMVRGRDACWEHCVLVDATRQKVRCNYCQREFSGGVYRMKFHLAQIKNKDIVPCTEVPINVRDMIHSMLSTPKKQKLQKKKKKNDRAVNGPENSSSASGGFQPNPGSSGQHGSTCPSLLLPQPSPSAHQALDDAQKQKLDEADRKLALFFFHNSIPLSASKSIYYQEMVDAVAECGMGYKAPSYGKLRTSLLEKTKVEITDNFKKFRDDWREKGCTVMLDSCRRPDSQGIRSIVYLERFWKSARDAVSISEPLVKILRMVDGDMPAMGYIYEGIERAKMTIKVDYKMRNDFQVVMKKMVTGDKDMIELTKEHPASEWPTESESSSLLLDDSWLDNLPFEGGDSPSGFE